MPVRRLAEAVWEERLPASAKGSLQTYIGGLRGIHGAERIATSPTGFALRVPDGLDTLHFGWLLDDAAEAVDPAAERPLLTEALALWRGEPFQDLSSAELERTERPGLTERHLARWSGSPTSISPPGTAPNSPRPCASSPSAPRYATAVPVGPDVLSAAESRDLLRARLRTDASADDELIAWCAGSRLRWRSPPGPRRARACPWPGSPPNCTRPASASTPSTAVRKSRERSVFSWSYRAYGDAAAGCSASSGRTPALRSRPRPPRASPGSRRRGPVASH